MTYISEFLIAAFTAAILQNAVFARGLGASGETLALNKPRGILRFGAFLIYIVTLSAALAWPLNYLLRLYRLSSRLGIRYLSSITTLLCICLVFALTYVVTRAWLPRLHYALRPLALPAALNTAVLGAILLAFSSGYGYLKTCGFAFGSGAGYMLALLLISEGRKRIALSDVPRAFRGLPVALIYIGILSLAIYGLIGHQLPT